MSKKEKKEQEEIIEELADEESEAKAEITAENTIEANPLAELRQQLEDSQQEAGENLAGWQRAQAEFMNYKKRIEREQTQLFENASARVIKRFLAVLDDLDRALQNSPQNGRVCRMGCGDRFDLPKNADNIRE